MKVDQETDIRLPHSHAAKILLQSYKLKSKHVYHELFFPVENSSLACLKIQDQMPFLIGGYDDSRMLNMPFSLHIIARL